MKTLKFEGYSDDTFGECGVTVEDIDNCGSGKLIQCLIEDIDNCGSGKPIQCLISAGSESLLIIGQYSVSHLSGCWTIGISMEAEGKAIPNWNIRFKTGDIPYSPVVEIDVPDNFTFKWFDNRQEIF